MPSCGSAAHAELETALVKYNSAAGKAARQTERAAVDKKSLELERVQDLINQVSARCCCEAHWHAASRLMLPRLSARCC